MGKQLHKRLATKLVLKILRDYEQGRCDAKVARLRLGVGERRFYQLLKEFRQKGRSFSVKYERKSPKKVTDKAEKAIRAELRGDQKLVEDSTNTVKNYNYSFVRETLQRDYGVEVSLPTIIDRAKKAGCYIKRRKKKRVHDREVITNHVGELAQHDTSIHKWTPFSEEYWKAIVSLDDCSRYILFGDLFRGESSWKHIVALEAVSLEYGVPLKYYVDNHSIFRFVKERDAFYKKNILGTDDVDPQWKQVANECGIEVIFALSAQAKGKVERPYRWMQDHVVRRCARDRVVKYAEVREIFRDEITQYNTRRVHHVTGEIPVRRFNRLRKEGKSVFNPFAIPEPYKKLSDIFCFREKRFADAYRKVSYQGTSFKLSGVQPRDQVELRISYSKRRELVIIRFWSNGKFIGEQTVKPNKLKRLQF